MNDQIKNLDNNQIKIFMNLEDCNMNKLDCNQIKIFTNLEIIEEEDKDKKYIYLFF